jgi:diguanylate cyclase (GGDEF)-like protein/PAS domain S-box-containing protein
MFVWEKPAGQILAVNQSACQAYGFSEQELLKMSVLQLRLQDPDSQAAPLPDPGSVVERTHRTRDGKLRENEMHTRAVVWGGKPALMTLLVDVTERKASEHQVERIGRLYATSNKINRIIFGLPNRASILQSACEIAVEAGAYPLAWIGILNETGYVDVAAHAGIALAYLRNIRVTIRDVPEGRGPMGVAMRERRTLVEHNFLESASTAPWREEAARNNLRSAVFAPILEGGAVIGALGLYGSERGMFQEQEQQLITELAADIGFALDDLQRSIRLHTEERIRSLAMEVYESIASDAPLARIGERLSAMLLECVADVKPPNATGIEIPLVGLVHASDADLPVVRSVEKLATIAIERARAREQLEHQALHDALTGLPNRVLLNDRLAQALAAARRHKRGVAVGLLDLDRFKVVNDTLGHAQGDLLLREVALRLNEGLRADETIARMGGDEFLVIFTDIENQGQADDAARRLLAPLERPFQIAGRELYVRASFGLVMSGHELGEDGATLLRRADRAMYRAKRAGSGYVLSLNEPPELKIVSDLDVESDLHRALQNNEFILHYQPFVDSQTQRVIAVEALIRWQHPVHGTIAPDDFIPVAEATGMILPIGEWTLLNACSQAASWAREGYDVAIAVNISARQFAQSGLESSVENALAQSGLRPDRLWLEVTETSIMDSPSVAAQTLANLKRAGVRIAIDDFGTGYSSLAYLHRFPIDMLKIDRSFVSGLGGVLDRKANSGLEIARAIVALANGLGVGVVAEGVETADQHSKLREFGCTLMQGYLFHRPMPPAQIPSLLRLTLDVE